MSLCQKGKFKLPNSLEEKIKYLREASNMTQTDLARRLGLTRAGVNSWEHGISKPSIDCIIELARLFHVSTDYLLGMKTNTTIDVQGLRPSDIFIIQTMVNRLKN